MALTISTGFVVDDAIVVLENIAAAHRGRHAAAAGRAARRARGRLHRAVDQRVADRGVRADPADGRHRRAAVPRVRDDAVDRDPDLARRLADHDADDVRPVPARAARSGTGTALFRASESAFERDAPAYGRTLGWALRHPLLVLVVLRPTIGAQRLSIRHDAEGLLSPAGHGPDDRRHLRPTRASRSRR